MDTPRKTKLYNQLAKDYTPKHADMMICKYIEGLESRIRELEVTESAATSTIATLETRLAALEKAPSKSRQSASQENESK